MSECIHDCSNCASKCVCAKQDPKSFLEAPHELSRIKKVIGVVSGKGGVGKSLVSALMAVTLNRRELKTAVLDADITGPSIPKLFGIHEKAKVDALGCWPAKTRTGIDVMSVNLLLENDTDPVAWRGPIIAGCVKQFWQEVIWQEVDYMFVDMPPGTGDVALTVFQSLPIDGIIVVTSPQDLVSMIVEKAVKLATMMNIPILGIGENMSWLECPDCGKKIALYGESHVAEIAANYLLPVLAQIPIQPELARQCDLGVIESYEGSFMEGAADHIEAVLPLDK